MRRDLRDQFIAWGVLLCMMATTGSFTHRVFGVLPDTWFERLPMGRVVVDIKRFIPILSAPLRIVEWAFVSILTFVAIGFLLLPVVLLVGGICVGMVGLHGTLQPKSIVGYAGFVVAAVALIIIWFLYNAIVTHLAEYFPL